jgi:hypothetical protein
MIKKLLQNKSLLLFCAIFWTIGIFIGCAMPGSDLPKVPLFPNFDKLVHFIFFFVFMALWYLVLQKNYIAQNIFLFILLNAFLYGYALEFYQKFCVEGRSFDRRSYKQRYR